MLQPNWYAQISHYLKRHLGRIAGGERKEEGATECSDECHWCYCCCFSWAGRADMCDTHTSTQHRLAPPQPGIWAQAEAEGEGVGYLEQKVWHKHQGKCSAQITQLHIKTCSSSFRNGLKLSNRCEPKHVSMDLMFNITALLKKEVHMRDLFP